MPTAAQHNTWCKGTKAFNKQLWDNEDEEETWSEEEEEEEEWDEEDADWLNGPSPSVAFSLDACLVSPASLPSRSSAAPLPPPPLSPPPPPPPPPPQLPSGHPSATAARKASRSAPRSARLRMLRSKLLAPRPFQVLRQSSAQGDWDRGSAGGVQHSWGGAAPTRGDDPWSKPSGPIVRASSAPAACGEFAVGSSLRSSPPSSSLRLPLPAGVRQSPLRPTACFSMTVVGGDAAVEIAWRQGRYREGSASGPEVRVLPIVNADAEALEAVKSELAAGIIFAGGGASVQDVGELLPLLSLTLAGAREHIKRDYPSGKGGGLLERAVRRATGKGTEALSDFGRWQAADIRTRKEIDPSQREGDVAIVLDEKARVQSEARVNASVIFGRQSCSVCEEKFPAPWLSPLVAGSGGGGAALSCGHWVCLPCWRGYLSSVASCGSGVVRCPAFRCVEVVDRGAQAHLVPKGPEGDGLFAKLQRFQYEKAHLSIEATNTTGCKARVCPNPACGRLLQSIVVPPSVRAGSSSSSSSSSFNGGGGGGPSSFSASRCLPAALLCLCGVALCSSCGAEAHLGFTCLDMSQLSQKAAELEAEGQSMNWLRNNTKSCPKCKYPIEKNGGCLHMRCQQCSYYFCWNCGGPGESCRSFSCSGGGGGWSDYDQGGSSSGRHSVASQLSLYIRCMSGASSASSKRALLLRQAAKNHVAKTSEEKDEEEEEEEEGGVDAAAAADITLVVRLILLRLAWGKSKGGRAAEKGWKAAASALGESLQRLEMILHARTERCPGRKKHRRSKVTKSLTPRAIQAQKQREAKQPSRGHPTDEDGPSTNALAAILIDRELAELLELPPAAFRAAAFKALLEAVNLLQACGA